MHNEKDIILNIFEYYDVRAHTVIEHICSFECYRFIWISFCLETLNGVGGALSFNFYSHDLCETFKECCYFNKTDKTNVLQIDNVWVSTWSGWFFCAQFKKNVQHTEHTVYEIRVWRNRRTLQLGNENRSIQMKVNIIIMSEGANALNRYKASDMCSNRIWKYSVSTH